MIGAGYKYRLPAILAVVLLILPSLYAQTAPPDSLLKGWSSGPSWFQFLKVLFFLALVLGLIWFSLAALKRVSRKAGSGIRGVEVVGGLSLGPRRNLLFVKIGSSLHVIGATDHHLSSIAIISDPEEIAMLESGGINANQPSFGALLRKFTGQGDGEVGAPRV